MNRTKSTFLALVAILLSPIAANADLIDLGDSTLDDSNGLEWLDFTVTRGLSINDILGGVGGYIDNYRYATYEEVLALFASAGLNNSGPTQNDATGYANMLLFNTLFNSDGTSCGVNVACGIAPLSGADTFGVNVRIFGDPGEYQSYIYSPIGFSLDYTGYGHMLVRDVAVPEPGSLALLGIGLLGMGAARRRKKA